MSDLLQKFTKSQKPKVFISVPMQGRSPEEIRNHQKEIYELLIKDKFDMIDNYIEDVDPNRSHNRMWCLGRAIQLLGEADLAIFVDDWYKYYGCSIEHAVCMKYGIQMCTVSDLVG